ncbi:MAG TPA: HD-GYP domain-containing protein [Dehalococcoidia bacterium]|nr:HD-GYP domain-containing protein [Dehalococcoidia bacterium]
MTTSSRPLDAAAKPPAKRRAPKTAPKPESRLATELSSWPTRLFFGAEILLALALFIAQAPRLEGDFALLAMLIILNVAAELKPIPVYGDTYISVGFVITTSIMVLFGGPGVVLAAPIEAVAGRLGRRKLDYKAVTNAAMFTIVYSAGAAAYDLIADVNPSHVSTEMIPAAIAAVLVSFVLNAVLVACSVRLTHGDSLSDLWNKHTWVAPQFIGLGIIGMALVSAYVALGIAGIVAFLTPAFMMRLSMKQYVDKTVENVEKLKNQNKALQSANVEIRRVSEELRYSYDGTLEALVNALDARDQETKGHSIRVSKYMLQIAREMGVKEGTTEWTDMQRGSLLHDVGKIGVSDMILLKPGKLTDEEWTKMRLHPEIGYNMIRQVKFLEGAAELILQHHERWDGKGYPAGLNEEEILLGSRIFSVVDTFDSMTSDRPYRLAMKTQDALNEILRCSGTQFDPMVVEAFLDTYEKWVQEREEMIGSADSPISMPHAA